MPLILINHLYSSMLPLSLAHPQAYFWYSWDIWLLSSLTVGPTRDGAAQECFPIFLSYLVFIVCLVVVHYYISLVNCFGSF